MSLGELTLQEAAKEAAGNWRTFDSFVWHRPYREEIENPDDWTIVYTHHRDSGLADQSNAAAIESALEPFTEGDDPDVVSESHNHWAVGWIDGYSIRVFRNGQITKAFRTYHELAEAMDSYPILDEEDYSNREYEATIENIRDAAPSDYELPDGSWADYELPEGWEYEVFSWLWDNDQGAVENRDDQGGYPSEESLRAAFVALGYAPDLEAAE